MIRWLADGTPFAERYGDVYRSRAGAGQASEVFVVGNRLEERWAAGESIALLETGFGLGLNCAATLEAFARSRAGSPEPRLRYTAIELHPAPHADVERAHGAGPSGAVEGDTSPVSGAARRLVDAYPELLERGATELEFGSARVTIELVLGDGAAALARIEGPIDAFYLDGFAPDRNRALWSDEVFAELARLARPGASLATYTVAASVRSGLSAAGFDTEKRPGFGMKRHRLVGWRRSIS